MNSEVKLALSSERAAEQPSSNLEVAALTEPDRRLESVFHAHSSRVHRTLRALGVHPSSLDDALQDVFLIVHDKLPSFVPNAKLSTWIYAITYRVAQNYRRRIKHSTHTTLSGEELSTEASPESEAAAAQAANFVRKFCDGITEEKRDVFVLCVLEERAAPEVASLLNEKLNTVYSRLRIVRAEFRQRLLKEQVKEDR